MINHTASGARPTAEKKAFFRDISVQGEDDYTTHGYKGKMIILHWGNDMRGVALPPCIV